MKFKGWVLMMALALFAGGFFLSIFLSRANAQSVPSAVSAAQTLAASQPISPQTVPVYSFTNVGIPGSYWSLQISNQPPLPFNPFPDLTVYSVGDGNYLIDDRSVDYPAFNSMLNGSSLLIGGGRFHAMDMEDGPPSPGGSGDGGGDGTNSYTPYVIPTNGLWLQITNTDQIYAYLNLNNATNQVYEILTKTDLNATNWNTEAEVWPTNAVSMPFVIPQLGRTNLFVWAWDWTGVTENGNTTPDWWFWGYFGTTALSDTNRDSQGNTLLYDYQNSIPPNVIGFSLAISNNYVNTSQPPIQLSIFSGSPTNVAILLDSLNFAAATWTPYTTSNLNVNLGTTEGWHSVWIGLCGGQLASPSWQRIRFNLDVTPPLLVVTNPMVGTVSRPTVQVQGYCPETLASLSYDLSNTVGLVTNLPATITSSYYDTNVFACTTNWFQLYDVGLAGGTNTITLHAKDLAGNVTTTNFILIFDLSGDTNAPALTLYWPNNGDQISGSSFTLRGWIDNPTAQVQAQIVDTNGVTNLIAGLVDRNGLVWAENLPLTSGTNFVTLTATDAAGNSSSTNLIVIAGDLALNITPVDASLLYQETVSVTGTIGDAADFTVWVNGVVATVDGYGNWTASNVPLNPGGTALIQARAIPNSENGGNGVGGGGAPSDANLCNPNSPDSVTVNLEEDRPYELVIGTYYFHLLMPFDRLLPGWTESITVLWDSFGTDSQEIYDFKVPGYEFSETNSPPGLYLEHTDIDDSVQETGGVVPWQYNADTMLRLFTGGKGVSGGQILFQISASATIVTDDYWISDNDPPVPGYAALPAQMQVAGQTPDADGNVYAVYEANTTKDISVTVPGQKHIIFDAGAAGYYLTHTTHYPALTDTNRSRLNLGVGEEVDFGGMPTNTVWTTSAGGLSATNGSGMTFTAPSNAMSATVTATVGNASVPTVFNVVAPSGVTATKTSELTFSGGNIPPLPGAGMSLLITYQPTSVSFYKVQVVELSEAASSVQGFFTNISSSGLYHTASGWIPLSGDNQIADTAAFIISSNPSYYPPNLAGSAQWIIPDYWRVGNSSTSNLLVNFTQTASSDANGTMTVTKLGQSVTTVAH